MEWILLYMVRGSAFLAFFLLAPIHSCLIFCMMVDRRPDQEEAYLPQIHLPRGGFGPAAGHVHVSFAFLNFMVTSELD